MAWRLLNNSSAVSEQKEVELGGVWNAGRLVPFHEVQASPLFDATLLGCCIVFAVAVVWIVLVLRKTGPLLFCDSLFKMSSEELSLEVVSPCRWFTPAGRDMGG